MNHKTIAIFLAVMMLMSILPIFFSGSSKYSNEDESSVPLSAPGFDTIAGSHVSHELNSIADGLSIAPQGVSSAHYLDVSRINGTPLESLLANLIPPYEMYNAKVSKTFYADYTNEQSWFQLHTISPEIIAFDYWVSPTPYNGYQFLVRITNDYRIGNVVGTPMMYGPQKNVESVIDVLSGNVKKSSDFDHILSYVEMGAEFQRVDSITDGFADQFYVDLKKLADGRYSRTVVYLNPSNSTLENITKLQANSTERGIIYDVTTDGDITKVEITSDVMSVISESWV
ncbi:MAG: hypothetical protein JXA38_04135 [Methanosarcinaceae archaeon]|nr:hypothetical protein [Methanosarcinaceae archaeon]